MVCVNSVMVYPGSVTLQKGRWYYGAWAEACPVLKTMHIVDTDYICVNIFSVNATNQSVIWSSSDEDVITVGTCFFCAKWLYKRS